MPTFTPTMPPWVRKTNSRAKVAALGEDGRAIGKLVSVHLADAIFKILAGFNKANRAEYFLLTAGHGLGNIVKNRGADKVAVLKTGHLDIAAVKQ